MNLLMWAYSKFENLSIVLPQSAMYVLNLMWKTQFLISIDMNIIHRGNALGF